MAKIYVMWQDDLPPLDQPVNHMGALLVFPNLRVYHMAYQHVWNSYVDDSANWTLDDPAVLFTEMQAAGTTLAGIVKMTVDQIRDVIQLPAYQALLPPEIP